MAIVTLVLKPGETGIVPAHAKILSVTNEGGLTVSATCDELDNALQRQSSLETYRFIFESGSSSDSHDSFHTFIASVDFAGTSYPVQTGTGSDFLSAGEVALKAKIIEKVPKSVFKVVDMNIKFDNGRHVNILTVKMTDTVAKSITMTLGGHISGSNLQNFGTPAVGYGPYFYKVSPLKVTTP